MSEGTHDAQVAQSLKAIEPDNRHLPGIALALRFGTEDGFFQQFFAKQRDLVARELQGAARCLLTFKELGNNPFTRRTGQWKLRQTFTIFLLIIENRSSDSYGTIKLFW